MKGFLDPLLIKLIPIIKKEEQQKVNTRFSRPIGSVGSMGKS